MTSLTAAIASAKEAIENKVGETAMIPAVYLKVLLSRIAELDADKINADLCLSAGELDRANSESYLKSIAGETKMTNQAAMTYREECEHLRQRVAELNNLSESIRDRNTYEQRLAAHERTNASYKNLTTAQEGQLTALRQRLYSLKEADKQLDSERQANALLSEQLAAHEAVIKQMREALLKVARMAEDLKRPCGLDHESPQAIRNGLYMNISYAARAALILQPTTEHLDAYVKSILGEPVAWASKLPDAHGYSVWQQKPLSDWWVRHEKLLIPLYALKEGE